MIERNVEVNNEDLEKDVDEMLDWARLNRGGDSGVRGGLIPPRPELVDGVERSSFHLPGPQGSW